jgi:hypothetical protein
MKTLKVLKYAGFAVLGIGFVFLFVYVTMCLWNWLIPALFHGPVLGYWQTAGLFILSKILLTGVAPGGHNRGHGREWRDKYYGKYHNHCSEKREESAVPQA